MFAFIDISVFFRRAKIKQTNKASGNFQINLTEAIKDYKVIKLKSTNEMSEYTNTIEKLKSG